MTQRIYTPEEAQKKFEALPREVKDAIYSSETLTSTRMIGEKHQLHLDQMGILQAEISAVLMGFTDTTDFPEVLAEELKVDEKTAGSIAEDVSEQVISKIRGSMKQADTKVATSKIPSTPPAITNAPVPPSTPETKSVVMPSAAKATVPMADIKPTMPAAGSAPIPPKVTPVSTPGPVSKPVSAQPSTPAAKPATPPVVATVAPTTPVAPKVDELLLKPSVSAAPKPAAPSAPVVIPAKPDAPAASAATTPAPAAPPPPPIAHVVDPYREPID
jgi:hypothetical protein